MEKSNIFADIWSSFRSMALWVQLWVAFLLFPINVACLFFLAEPRGPLIAFLAIIGMVPNIPIIFKDRGFSKLMAFPHIIPWAILVGILLFAKPVGSSLYNSYLTLLLVVDFISLAFDIPDAIKWVRGDRAVSR